MKARREHWRVFLSKGFMLEGVYSGYFRGSDAYCMYSGRLMQNCRIAGAFEDMCLWVKNGG